MIFLYCPPVLRDILLTSMAQCSLFVLKVPLNTKQTNKLSLSLLNVVSKEIRWHMQCTMFVCRLQFEGHAYSEHLHQC